MLPGAPDCYGAPDMFRELPIAVHPEVAERLRRLELPFGPDGIDPYGVDRAELARFFTIVRWLYRDYFTVRVHHPGRVPPRGAAMLVGNHSGGVAVDGLMVVGACFFELEPPRLAQGMADRFLARLPFVAPATTRLGHFTGLPEHAERLLGDGRLLMVFPEGTRGTAKLYHERDSLVRFGTGFLRIAQAARVPIVPFGFVGAGEAVPTVVNLYRLGRLFGLPYVPLTPWLLPLPRPTELHLVFGEPMRFEGDESTPDEVVQQRVEQVRARIAALIAEGRAARDGAAARREARP